MIRRVLLVVLGSLAIVFDASASALAWDPLREGREREATPTPRNDDPAPFIAPPPGIYYVTDTYVADVVTTDGPLTTYTTSTVHESTGSYARVLDVVATGIASPYDGAAFNGRRSLADGRLIAGTYYQTYVLIDGAFVPVSIVFFQDDAEWQRLSAPSSPASPPTATAPAATPSPAPICCGARPTGSVAPRPSAPPARPVRPTLSLQPAGAPVTRLEVLRGRRIALWLRAFVDDREIPVSEWRLVAGEPGDAGATSGRGGTPFVASWPRLAPPGTAYELSFRVQVDTPETGRRAVDVSVAVVVRAPALESLR